MARENKRFTCVICPTGCQVDVEAENGTIVSMEGNQCPKAEEFIAQELIEPMRTLTSTVRISGAKWDMLPVRTDKPIPKRLFFEVMRELAAVELQGPVSVGDVIIENIQGTGANVIATRNMLRESLRAA
ncbi:MAG: DUF1667 domain-containing protein [Deltaproteobacteria bacterium]|nr:DUF1667 domain-containing protein [Deltaproteobacteria bacterium]